MPIRPAQLSDLDALVALEALSFTTNRMSRRTLRRMIQNPKALMLVDVIPSSAIPSPVYGGGLGWGPPHTQSEQAASPLLTSPHKWEEEQDEHLRGVILLFRHARSRLARIYSLATHPDHRGQGIAEGLMAAAEAQCGKPGLKLEIRTDNHKARTLYERLGYRIRREIPDFYEDGCTAYEMVKDIGNRQQASGISKNYTPPIPDA